MPRPFLALDGSMRLEQLPIILGIIVALIGLTMALDAWQSGGIAPFRERRRRTRAVPHTAGQTLVAVGTICLGIALIGRDTWKYTTVTVLLGVVLLIAGAIMNRVYLKEVLFFRGAARRGQGEENSRLKKEPPGKSRIR
jgi:xanthine/uracil permease